MLAQSEMKAAGRSFLKQSLGRENTINAFILYLSIPAPTKTKAFMMPRLVEHK